ncbi:hypothetical protein [Luteimonas fraxinea]|uniref:hypothetical protein n=1 Tax=Luteimonas fraxinea TaxID=2901869 RepID=UPI001E5E5CFF|nr:hypothetical protein [Luteimonas fraxinea]MCD9125862.1 hypothetical protein [Luteimonas fraxinea]
MSQLLTLEIFNAEVERNAGTSAKTGNAYDIRFQRAKLEMPNGETRIVEMQHEDNATDKDALPPGRYEPKRSAVYLDSKKKLVISLRARSWQLVEASKAAPAVAKQ